MKDLIVNGDWVKCSDGTIGRVKTSLHGTVVLGMVLCLDKTYLVSVNGKAQSGVEKVNPKELFEDTDAKS